MDRVRRVFGIGLNKTGTKSLHDAVAILGYSPVHIGKQTSLLIFQAIDQGRPVFEYCHPRVAEGDAYFDARPMGRHFDVFDKEFPGSRFILHTRDLASWLESREKHVRANQQLARRGLYKGQWLSVDRGAWNQEWHIHHDLVRTYFSDRPRDLLEIDVTSGEGWQKLCPFLEQEIPSVGFPWINPHSDRNRLKARLKLSARQARGWLRSGNP